MWSSHSKCLCRQTKYCQRQQPQARGWAGLPQNIRKFLPDRNTQQGSWCSLSATDFVWMHSMRDTVGCHTLLRTGRTWREYFCLELNPTGKTTWRSIQTVSYSTREAIWTWLCAHSTCLAHTRESQLSNNMCVEKKNHLDATEWFIALIICSTCFGHFYAHHQEL